MVLTPALALALALAACASQPAATVTNAAHPGATAQANAAAAQVGLSSKPSSTPGSYLAGIHAERMGDFAQAADYLLYALKQNPDNLELLQRTFLLTLSEGRMDDAMDLARRLNERIPDAPLPALTLAIRDFQDGKFQNASVRLQALPDTGLNKFFVPLMLAWIEAGAGHLDKAIDKLDPLGENSAFAVLRDLHAAFLNDLAGRTDAAAEGYKAAIEAGQAGSLRLVQALGRLYERTGATDKAKALYEDYVAQNPDTILLDPDLKRMADHSPAQPLVASATDGMVEALFNVAGTLQQQNVGIIALSYARLALLLKPDFPVCQALMADILDSQGRDDEAVKVYASIAKDSPFHWLGRLRESVYLDSMGKTDEAVALLNTLADERPDRTDMLVTMGDILRSHERFKEAEQAYSRALDRIPKLEERHWAILYARGIVRERSHEWSLAEGDFLKSLELRPDQPYVLNYLAYSWLEKGINLERAKSMLERAYELRPNDGFIVDSMGWILLRLGQVKQAVAKLELAVELEPQDPTINDHLGDAYWHDGRFAEAKFQWRRALALKPDPDAIPKIEAKLQNGLAVSRAESPGT
ncbi:MAG: tetratricopeptide repeat protein [Alphaproteobacteria bacterium]